MPGAQGVQRKVFRIEQMFGGGRDSSVAGPRDHGPSVKASESHQRPEAGPTLARELAAIRSAIDRNMRELSVLINDGNDRRMTRAAGELGAAIKGMETATQKILASAEVIDDSARALASALSNDYHHGLAQDVQDHVVRIYEACNFQDLAGQRIGKVIATLIMVEGRLVAMIARYSGAEQSGEAAKPSSEALLNDPRLDGATVHASQLDIDAMFA
jgi:chemotaxis protein CheZ